jgi:hypothetical protein
MILLFAAVSCTAQIVLSRLGKRPYRNLLSKSQRDLWLDVGAVDKSPRQITMSLTVTNTQRTNMITMGSSETWLVFRGGHEYVFTHGEFAEVLTVTLSTSAINLFEKYNVTANDLAKQAAEWALYIKRTSGTVDFSTTTDDLSEFCRYYFGNEMLRKRACGGFGPN